MNFVYIFLFLAAASAQGHAAYILKEGKLIKKEELATLSVQEHYSILTDMHQKQEWKEVIHQAAIITRNFPATPFAHEALFYLGIAHFHLNDDEIANNHLTAYLRNQATPRNFEEAIHYKFAIAKKFQKGAKKHLMGMESLPKWMPAREDALAIYDEVIAALPHHDLAAEALFGKGELFFKDEDYKESVEAYQTLIRRFPKHALSPESYLGIGKVYLTQCQTEYPDNDFLDLAEINMRKFRQDFPGEDRIVVAEKMFEEMQEIYAKNLYETAQFFERTKKPKAAVIYYSKISRDYPRTKTAAMAEKRLYTLGDSP